MVAVKRGRFAPTPSGMLHLGSLVTAVASYLSVKSIDGHWLVRIEDVDGDRTQPGAAAQILKTLEAFGLYWDEQVVYQSERSALYSEIVNTLLQSQQAYLCSCSRREIGKGLRVGVDGAVVYPRYCALSRQKNTKRDCAIRVRTNEQIRSFHDRVFGLVSQNIDYDVGDFVIKRSDGFFAYHLAVVVDDAMQGITEVVRGSDLLVSTPRHILLQNMLRYETPAYAHVPLVLNANGEKLSKQTKAPLVCVENATELLIFCLRFLGQKVPNDFEQGSLKEILDWGIQNWHWEQVPQKPGITI
jgi:glutamyl-Q tRNA(Asp) synthetase